MVSRSVLVIFGFILFPSNTQLVVQLSFLPYSNDFLSAPIFNQEFYIFPNRPHLTLQFFMIDRLIFSLSLVHFVKWFSS